MALQLPLGIKFSDHVAFDNFFIGDNAQAVMYLCNILQEAGECSAYLYGPRGVGLSHLLQACCYAATEQGKVAAYLPLAKPGLSYRMLEGVEQLALVCIDDIDTVAGQDDWEEALFHCYNRLQASQVGLVIATHVPPKQIAWNLPDLQSRLAALPWFPITPLSDPQKIFVLQQRAKQRGLDIPAEVSEYLLNHYPRDTRELLQALDKLDQASLIAQRRLTIPFVKKILAG
jgi:DnaA family protein